MSETAKPRVSIGMPVFNGAATVDAAIASITNQTYPHFELIISDNASTDATASICQRFTDKDSRIKYLRQERNIGAEANFDEVLRLSVAEYFMWAAADDIRSPDYLERCVEFLDNNPDYVAAACPAHYTGKSPSQIVMGDGTLDDDDRYANIINVFDAGGNLRVNGRFYALFRTALILFWLKREKHYLGSDWAFTLEILKCGKYRQLGYGFTELGENGASKQRNIFAAYRSRPIHWFLPFLDLSLTAWKLVSGATVRQKLELFKRLLLLNMRIAKKQIIFEMKRHRIS